MPRRSSRAVPASAAAPASAPKRRASDRISAASRTGPKRQKYEDTTAQKAVNSTAKKSKYFQEDTSEEPKPDPKHASAPEASNYNDSDTSVPASPDANPEVPEAAPRGAETTGKSQSKRGSNRGQGKNRKGEEPSTPARKASSGTKASTTASASGKELWREGVTTGLGPGKEVFIKKPKARDPGAVAYQDDTLHPNTMLFLQDLAANNDREWLKAHDADYRASKKDWETFVETLTEEIIEKDSTIPELPVKDLVFRIHRDIRFSKNPTPYKTHFSAAWSRTGKKGPYAAYYVHCQPGSCFVGSGLWMPEADKLALLRQDVDRNSHRLKSVLRADDMRREIFNGLPDDDDKAVEAFVSQNKESALKTKPRSFLHRLTCFHGSPSAAGYEVDNENIQLLRLRSFTIGRPLSDEELLSPTSARERIAALIGIMEPFVSHSTRRAIAAV
ncbi:hypothetical protein BO70DRAFT_290842 [Aspergillus heteromorphus CBS 117.55]|uniref:TIGR02453 family protein n=1 Tax=Aspergillus heteromorphus CBS 117.55 TaxID=1448321 RepID=A0A317WBC6_9EURO|nr:uncharacterized protein BO70DRAFT_290842 [Aspergillus heteromorphus CBS 117.55]PWY83499.1 hypothetical protein BO70DRAFT_290842 [Aspergillus heteromorphus CBS 117.55]